jgi:tRNA(Ile2) C34 agmatinyltransferase TiaS
MDEFILVLGILILIGGVGAFVWGDSEADEMGLLRYAYPDDYQTYRDISSLGAVVAVMGGVVLLIGAAAGSKPARFASVQARQPIFTGVINFCPYCGNQIAPGALRCQKCGRRF